MAFNYNRQLQTALKKYFTKEQIDQFQWYNDKDSEDYYEFVFIDHNKRPRNLVLRKESGTISLK